jgi:hypothetical protein
VSGETDTLRLGGGGDNGDDGPGWEGYGGVRCGPGCGPGCNPRRGTEGYRGSLRVRLVIGVVLRVRGNVTDAVPTVA